MRAAARYTKIDSGYMGQLVEWPAVISEGATVEECRAMLDDALREMALACSQRHTAPSFRYLENTARSN